MTSAAKALVDIVDPAPRAVWTARAMMVSVFVGGQAQAAELPARRRIEEIAVGRAGMPGGRRERRAAQYHLIDHELAVIFAQRPGRRLVPGIWGVGAASPLPDDGVWVNQPSASGSSLPFGFCGQILACPSRECICFVIADMTSWQSRIDRAQTAKRHRMPDAVDAGPVAWRVP